MICPSCGAELVVGSWPFCPDHTRGGSYNAQPNDWPGGKTFENLGGQPVTLYSRSELRRELKARGLEECVRHVPIPGTDKSPHTQSWVSVDLDAARALAERQAHTKATSHEPDPSPEIVGRVKRTYEELSAR
jgi:hypothetical protein